jgi:hypothetical protein
VVLITIFKPFDNLLPLITFYLPIISLLIYSNSIFIIFCLTIFSLFSNYFSPHLFQLIIYYFLPSPLFSLSNVSFPLLPIISLLKLLFPKQFMPKYASQCFSYFNSFPSMIILICRDFVNSTMNNYFFLFYLKQSQSKFFFFKPFFTYVSIFFYKSYTFFRPLITIKSDS